LEPENKLSFKIREKRRKPQHQQRQRNANPKQRQRNAIQNRDKETLSKTHRDKETLSKTQTKKRYPKHKNIF